MHFGEYELFPSLIGLSPLPTSHPKTFQRLLVRSSISCYRNFNLLMGRSQGFASSSYNLAPYSDSLSLRIRSSRPYPCYKRLTRRLIMQKARRRPLRLRPLVNIRFQVLFTLLLAVLFTFPSRYLFAIGLSVVFSLSGWCRYLHAGILLPRATPSP
jgi:hypothetical protein